MRFRRALRVMVLTMTGLSVSLTVSLSANAGMADISGVTTCTLISAQHKAKAHHQNCQYEGSVGASLTYAIQQIRYTMKNGFVIETDNSARFRIDEHDKLTLLSENVSINDQPAEIWYLDSLTLKRLPDASIQARFEGTSVPNVDDVLYCFRDLDHRNMFCVPYPMIINAS